MTARWLFLRALGFGVGFMTALSCIVLVVRRTLFCGDYSVNFAGVAGLVLVGGVALAIAVYVAPKR